MAKNKSKAKNTEQITNTVQDNTEYPDVKVIRHGIPCIQRFIGLSKPDQFGFTTPLWEIIPDTSI